jgi:dienelactone hydrolase
VRPSYFDRPARASTIAKIPFGVANERPSQEPKIPNRRHSGAAPLVPFLARRLDRWLSNWLVKRVRRPDADLPRPAIVPDSPDTMSRPEWIAPRLTKVKENLWKYEAVNESPLIGQEHRVLRGKLMGPLDSRAAVVVLHGAYAEYVHCEMAGRSFVKQGFRVLIPAAPFHLDRALPGTFNGAPMFWSTPLFVSSLAQWLGEIRGLIGWLQREGVQQIGVIGHSVGSLAAGLAVTLWPHLDFAVLMSPVGHHLEAINRSPIAARIWPWMKDLAPEEMTLLDRWAPRRRRPLVKRLLFMITVYDDLQPTHLQREWLHDWGQPPNLEFRHGHISLCYSRQLYRNLEAFARETRGE